MNIYTRVYYYLFRLALPSLEINKFSIIFNNFFMSHITSNNFCLVSIDWKKI